MEIRLQPECLFCLSSQVILNHFLTSGNDIEIALQRQLFRSTCAFSHLPAKCGKCRWQWREGSSRKLYHVSQLRWENRSVSTVMPPEPATDTQMFIKQRDYPVVTVRTSALN